MQNANEGGAVKAADIMTRDVVTVGSDATVADAIRLMLEHHVSGLPVLSGHGRLVGIVTESDLLRRAELGTEKSRIRWLHLLFDPDTLAADYTREHGRRITSVMTNNVVTASVTTPIDEIVDLMEQHHIKRLPIIDNQHVVGIISRADVLQALAMRTGHGDKTNISDRTIRRQLHRALHELRWLKHRPQVSIRDGIIDFFWIDQASDWERSAARVAAENIPGVKQVRDNFVRSA